jgi:DnaJ-class molecular chaperone
MTTTPNYYQILGVSRNCTKPQIKRAYYNLAKKYHPDAAHTGNQEQFRLISLAYQTLSNDEERTLYDMKLDSDTLNYVHMRSTAYPFEAQTYTNYEGMDFFQTRREMRRVLYQEEVREEWAKKRARMMHGLRAILVVFLFVCVLRYMIFKVCNIAKCCICVCALILCSFREFMRNMWQICKK